MLWVVQFEEEVKMQQLALRKAQDFILRAGNSGRGHCMDRRQIYKESSFALG